MVESGRFWFEGGRSGWYFFGSSSGSFHECLDVLLRAHFDVCVAHGRPDIGVAGGLLDAHQVVSLAREPVLDATFRLRYGRACCMEKEVRVYTGLRGAMYVRVWLGGAGWLFEFCGLAAPTKSGLKCDKGLTFKSTP